MEIGLYRDGDEIEVDVTLAAAGDISKEAAEVHPALAGAELESGKRNGIKGVIVNSVDPRSVAARIGLEEGDIITQVNRQRVETVRELSSTIADIKGNIVLVVRRGNSTFFAPIQ